MRVIMISTDRKAFDPASSVARRFVEYGRAMGELHVVVFTHINDGLMPLELSPEVRLIPTSSSARIFMPLDAARLSIRIGKTLFFGQTIITAQDPFFCGLSGVVAKKTLRVPLQVQIHTDFYSKAFYDGELGNWLRFEISRFVIPRADGYRVVREKIGEDLVRAFKVKRSRITVLPIWVNAERFADVVPGASIKARYPQFTSVVLMASRLTKEKDIPTALRGFVDAAKRFPGLGLVLVGDGPEKAAILREAKRLGIEDRVVMEPWQPDMPAYFREADLFLNTSRFEGYGMTLVEAAAAGTPILTTDVGIAADIFEDGRDAFICKTGDVGCVSQNLISFFENPSFQGAVAKGAREKVMRGQMSREEYLTRYVDSLQDILSAQQKAS